MKVITGREAMHALTERHRREGKTIGFVPTMGALHPGHISLVKKSARENNVTVVSIFVNPTQFNNPEDFNKYPRMPEEDLKLLGQTGCDVVFLPEVSEIYQEGGKKESPGDLAEKLEGTFRPGHFQGVVDVVSRFFAIVNPHNAYFGLKDYQQVQIIAQWAKQAGSQINIVPCPTEREADGLAMSSRNLRLSAEERKQATAIYQTLLKARELSKTLSPEEVKHHAIRQLNQQPLLRTEYFELVDAETLEPITTFPGNREVVACAAVYAGNIRLIDNIYL